MIASDVIKKLISNSFTVIGMHREWPNIFRAIFTSEYKSDFVGIVKEVVDLSKNSSSYNFMNVILTTVFI